MSHIDTEIDPRTDCVGTGRMMVNTLGENSFGTLEARKTLLFRGVPMPSGRDESATAYDYEYRRPAGRLPLETRYDGGTHVASLAKLADALEKSWPDGWPPASATSVCLLPDHAINPLWRFCAPEMSVEVQEYADRHQIAGDVSGAIDLASRVFPAIQSVRTRLQTDPDTDEVRVIIDVSVSAAGDKVLAAKKAYTKQWLCIGGAAARDRIRLLYHLS